MHAHDADQQAALGALSGSLDAGALSVACAACAAGHLDESRDEQRQQVIGGDGAGVRVRHVARVGCSHQGVCDGLRRQIPRPSIESAEGPGSKPARPGCQPAPWLCRFYPGALTHLRMLTWHGGAARSSN